MFAVVFVIGAGLLKTKFTILLGCQRERKLFGLVENGRKLGEVEGYRAMAKNIVPRPLSFRGRTKRSM